MTETSKQSRSQQLLLFAVCFAVAASYTWFAVKTYRAQRFAEHSEEAALKKAIALAPQNATYHDLLCPSMIFVSQAPEQAVNECLRASKLNPYSSSIWLDLAQAYLSIV